MFHRPAMMATALFAALSLACGDEVTDPDALLESAEAEAVLRSAAALPALPPLVDGLDAGLDTRDHAALLRARELWIAGSAADDARGLARRRLAVRYAAPVLGRTLPEAEWTEVRRGLEEWTSTAGSMLRHLSLPAVDLRVRSARTYLDRADGTTGAAAATDLLLAAAELVETTPRFVARSLTADAVSALDRAGDAADEPRLQRAHRLKDWALRAVEEEDYLLAIQRAYYALQLAEER